MVLFLILIFCEFCPVHIYICIYSTLQSKYNNCLLYLLQICCHNFSEHKSNICVSQLRIHMYKKKMEMSKKSISLFRIYHCQHFCYTAGNLGIESQKANWNRLETNLTEIPCTSGFLLSIYLYSITCIYHLSISLVSINYLGSLKNF